MTGTDYYPEKPVISISNRLQHIIGGCAGTQYGCNEDRSSRTKEEYEKYRKLTSITEAIPIEAKVIWTDESLGREIRLSNVIVVPEILLPILQPTVKDAEKIAITEICGIDNTFQEKLDTDTKEIADVARGALAGLTKGISKGIIVGVVVGIILLKVIK